MNKLIIVLVGLVIGITAGVGWFVAKYLAEPQGILIQRQTTAPNVATESKTSTTKQYASSTYGFSVQYPATWQYQESNKSSEPGRGGLLAMVTFSPDGSLSDQSVAVAIARSNGKERPAKAVPTTINGRDAYYHEDVNGERTYVIQSDTYRYSLLMGNAKTADVRAAYDELVRSFTLQ